MPEMQGKRRRKFPSHLSPFVLPLKKTSSVIDYILFSLIPPQPTINQRKEQIKMKKEFDHATRERVLAACLEGKTLRVISSETGVCLTLVKK